MGLEHKQVVESLRRQQRQAWLAGERIAVEGLLQPHPELQADADATLELIYNEMLLRQRSGDKPCQEEYQQRFPHLAGRLELLFEVHFALDEQTWPAGFRPAVTAPEQSGTDSDPVLPVVPGYEIVRELGRGGIGVVYEAWQKSLNRRVALKMLVAGACAGAEERARFRTEAEAAGRLNHVYIVPVHEVGESDGRPYLVMELIDGSSLAQHLSGTPWSPSPAADLVEKLARAIDYAHRQGIVHRDLKPANVLLQSAQDSARIEQIMEQPVGLSSSALVESTTPKITDFGLAKLLAGSAAARTQTGAFLGTPSYAAPEQAEGRRRDVGPAVDVYALGAILYELLTGRPPFRGETVVETLLQVQYNEPVSPSRLRPNLPRDLTTICLKCLQKDPARRYATAAALSEDLQRFLAGMPIIARPVGTLERTWRWCRRNPTVATLAGSVAVLVVIMAVSSTLGALLLRVDRDRANRAERAAKEELWRSLRDQAKALQASHRAGQRFESLKVMQEAASLARGLRLPEERFQELRNTAIASLILPDVDMGKDWQGQSHDSDGLDFDATLEIYAHSDQQGAVSIRRMSDNAEIARLNGSGSPAWTRFSPDGRFLAVLVRDTPEIKIWKLDGEQAVPWMQEPANGLPFDFSPDSRQVAIGQKDGTIRVLDLASRQLLHQLKSHPLDKYASLKFHPQRPLLAVAGSQSVQIYDVESEKVLAALPHPRVCYAVAWHPDGKMLVTSCADRKLYLWDVPARKQILVFEGHQSTGGIGLAFNHAGDLLASNDWHGVLRFWDPRTGRQVFSTPFLGGYPRFSSDDRLLAVTPVPGCIWLRVTHAGFPSLWLGNFGARGHQPGRALIGRGND
jgi:serine/threonine protein kinase